MNIPRYWAKAERLIQGGKAGAAAERHLIVWRGSDASAEDAQARAQRELEERIARFRRGERLRDYPGHIRPLREPVIETVSAPTGERIAVITRNAAGCRVINTAQVMFIDLDFASALVGDWRGALAALWRSIGGVSQAKAEPQERVLAKVRKWHEREASDWRVRVYRTRAGLRLLIAHGLFEPTSKDAQQVMTRLGADARYRRLCAVQACFRARLTPKPWRIGMARPPATYPWTNADEEARQRAWESRYEASIGRFAVCRLLADLGRQPLHPDAERVMRLHDAHTLSLMDKPLA
ncbi:MAG: hypothetical protein CFK52_02535 [Chloracidobacterium sp. CP2_5A]|nr:MAG: hypothetical protein CFK52_02535 [Chloracidobacterium sp. CP2_5A]